MCKCVRRRRRTLVTARDGGRPQQTFTPGSERASERGGDDDDNDDDSGQCRVVSPGSTARRQSPRHGAHPDPPPRAAAASVHGRPSRSAAVSRVAHRHTTRSSSHVTLYADFRYRLATMTFTGVLRVSLLQTTVSIPIQRQDIVSRTCTYSCSLLPLFSCSFLFTVAVFKFRREPDAPVATTCSSVFRLLIISISFVPIVFLIFSTHACMAILREILFN